MISALVFLVVLVAVCAIFQWFVTASGVSIPRPLVIAGYAVIAVLAILFVAGLAGIGPGIPLR